MVRSACKLIPTVAAVALVLLVAARVPAQAVVVAPQTTWYYYPAPTVTYYTPPVAYAPAPTVSYYYPSTVSYYVPSVSYYAAPSPVTTTYYGLFGRPRFTTTYYPPVYIGR
jgi:hypothetical protein